MLRGLYDIYATTTMYVYLCLLLYAWVCLFQLCFYFYVSNRLHTRFSSKIVLYFNCLLPLQRYMCVCSTFYYIANNIVKSNIQLLFVFFFVHIYEYIFDLFSSTTDDGFLFSISIQLHFRNYYGTITLDVCENIKKQRYPI